MSAPPLDEDAVAAADKEMEERANRAKALLSNRYKGLKTAQVREAPDSRGGRTVVTLVAPDASQMQFLYALFPPTGRPSDTKDAARTSDDWSARREKADPATRFRA
jgi:hypothetical protein